MRWPSITMCRKSQRIRPVPEAAGWGAIPSPLPLSGHLWKLQETAETHHWHDRSSGPAAASARWTIHSGNKSGCFFTLTRAKVRSYPMFKQTLSRCLGALASGPPMAMTSYF